MLGFLQFALDFCESFIILESFCWPDAGPDRNIPPFAILADTLRHDLQDGSTRMLTAQVFANGINDLSCRISDGCVIHFLVPQNSC